MKKRAVAGKSEKIATANPFPEEWLDLLIPIHENGIVE